MTDVAAIDPSLTPSSASDSTHGLADGQRGHGGAVHPTAPATRRHVEIRTARPDDRRVIGEIIAAAFKGREAIIGAPPEPLSLDIAEAIATRIVLLAVTAGEVSGVLVALTDAAGVLDVEVLAVAPDFTRQGIGRALMQRIEKQARRSGARALTLYTSARLPQNHAFYRSLGFHEARRSGMSTFERIHFEKPLVGRAQKAPVDGLYGRRRVHRHKENPSYDRLALDLETRADLAALFDARPVRLEVGFGGGEHLLHHARTTPGVGLIGVEPFETGMMRTAAAAEAEGLTNVRLYMGDARRVLDWLPTASLERADVLYPDPWHKQRHWKRRFISADGLDRLARSIRPDGVLRFASDIPSYVDWTRAHVAGHAEFTLEDDSAAPWQDWPGTRYEAKAIREGRVPRYLTIRRR